VSGQEIKNGDVMALLDGELIAKAEDPVSALVQMIQKSTEDAELITVYSGSDFSDGDAERALDAAQAAAGEAEVELVSGGQPHYDFLIAFE
jgi:hypothetical protein